MSTFDSATDKPHWSWQGVWVGFRRGLPVAPGIMVFGLVVGAAAARHGISGIENFAMNLLICSGIAQLAALEIWPSTMTWAAVASLSLLAAVIGARMFLMSVSMRPWFGQLPKWQAYLGLFFLAAAAQHLVGGWWFIIAGALAGAFAGAYFDERKK